MGDSEAQRSGGHSRIAQRVACYDGTKLQSPDDQMDPLRGGAATDAHFPDHHMLGLRFLGGDAIFSPVPENSRSDDSRAGVLLVDEISRLKAGDPFRAVYFHQVI